MSCGILSRIVWWMKVLPSFETSLTVYQSARGNIPQDINLMQHRCKNLKSRQLRVGSNENKSNASRRM